MRPGLSLRKAYRCPKGIHAGSGPWSIWKLANRSSFRTNSCDRSVTAQQTLSTTGARRSCAAKSTIRPVAAGESRDHGNSGSGERDAMKLDPSIAALKASNDELRARLTEAERYRDTVFNGWDVLQEVRTNPKRAARTSPENVGDVLDAIARIAKRAAASASVVQPERCCVDYPLCDCNSPPEPDNAPDVTCATHGCTYRDGKCIRCWGRETVVSAHEKAIDSLLDDCAHVYGGPFVAPALQPCGHPWKAQDDFKCILCSSPGIASEKRDATSAQLAEAQRLLHSADPIIHAQHGETGRMWTGPRSQLPRQYFECSAPGITP